jgi:ATP-dependent protease ClpP protease subunit
MEAIVSEPSTEPSKTIYLNFLDSINEPKVKAVMGLCSEVLMKEKPTSLYFLLSSAGGLVEPAIVLYNYLRALPVEIIMHSTGCIDSAALLVFLSAHKRFASKYSSFLIHGVTWTFPPNIATSWNMLDENISAWTSAETKYSQIVTENTKLKVKELKRFFAKGECKNSDFALDRGVIHEIKEPIIPKDSLILSFNLP